MYPVDRTYTKEHEWVREESGECTVGITAFAADQLGDVTYVDLPKVGAQAAQGDAVSAVESVKAASDVYTPVGGRVSEINVNLQDRPELVNQSPYDDGWFFKIADYDRAELDTLMDAAAYERYIGELEG